MTPVEEAREIWHARGRGRAGRLVAWPDPAGKRVYITAQVEICDCGEEGCRAPSR